MPILSSRQKLLLKKVGEDEYLCGKLFFTGGTALSEFYLQHRESEDLVFFAKDSFLNQSILEILDRWGGEMNFVVHTQTVDKVLRCILEFEDGFQVKTDFSNYVYRRLQPSKFKIGNLDIDSLDDMAVNKFFIISQRREVKDYVDLFFILKDHSYWDLQAGVRIKYRVEIEPLDIATNFMAVKVFDHMPNMLKKLTLDELKEFFEKNAEELSKRAAEK